MTKINDFRKFEEVRCNLCGGDSAEALDAVSSVVRCRNCGLVYVNPRPVEDELLGAYPDGYYQAWFPQEKGRLNLWQKRLLDLEQHKNNGKLLDIGCGIGSFLALAKKKFDVYGTEISRYAVDQAKKKFNIDVFTGYVEDAKFPDSYFDAITLYHVLEHIANPSKTILEIRRIIKPSGVLIIAVPNDNFWRLIIKRLLHKNRIYQPLNETWELHLYHFTPRTLKNLLEKCDFEVYKLSIDDYIPSPTLKCKINRRIHLLINGVTGINISYTMRIYARVRVNAFDNSKR